MDLFVSAPFEIWFRSCREKCSNTGAYYNGRVPPVDFSEEC